MQVTANMVRPFILSCRAIVRFNQRNPPNILLLTTTLLGRFDVYSLNNSQAFLNLLPYIMCIICYFEGDYNFFCCAPILVELV